MRHWLLLLLPLFPLSTNIRAYAQDNHPPTVKFIQPGPAQFLSTGQTIAYEIEVEDREDGFSMYKEIPPAEIFLQLKIFDKQDDAEKESLIEEPRAISMLRSSDCMSCHQVRKKYMGPSLLEISQKHKGNKALIIKSIKEGSKGQWGDIDIMPAHPLLSDDEIQELAKWIAGLYNVSYFDLLTGTNGVFRIDGSYSGQYLLLKATYLDHGLESAGPHFGFDFRVFLLQP